jgi:diaminopimelate epimerase
MTSPGILFAKGHGTGNDFVILTNLDGRLTVSADQVRRLCDRHQGIGADGVLVVARRAASAEVADQVDAEYFMDYRNADGSVAEMCGNGSRVFVRFLLEEGLVDSGEVPIATRGGTRAARVLDDGTICVEMGPAHVLDVPDLVVETVPEEGPKRSAIGVLMPNPHAVCWVEDVVEAGALLQPPRVSPAQAFPHGVNVEFVAEIGSAHVAMRVHERGVGETQSCGTGACAAAVATLARRGEGPGDQRVRVDVPGGTVQVHWRPDGQVELSGPAVIVARGTLAAQWWSQR